MRIDCPIDAEIPQLRRLWGVVFGDGDAFLDHFFSTAFSPNRCRCLWAGEEPATSLYWFDVSCQGQKFAYLYAIGTAPGHRNRGLCRMLVEDTKKHLRTEGYAGAILVPAGEPLFAMYETMGFETCSRVTEFETTAGNPPCQLYKIPPETYAKLRREFLPHGAVIQEGENLDFLQTQATFYHNPQCLMAASVEGDRLHCHELLGNIRLAPNILTATGCKTGFFRTVGHSKAFAMYCPLSADCPRPGYFGLAFD